MENLVIRLIDLICEEQNVNINDILHSRSMLAIRARAMIIYILYKYHNYSFKQIGVFLNHSESNISRTYNKLIKAISKEHKQMLKNINNLI